MAVDDDDIQVQLQSLREDYATQLPAKFEEIERYRSSVQQTDKRSSDDIKVLHRLVHSLAGSGATFGFADIGQQARIIEQKLKRWFINGADPGQDEQKSVLSLLDKLGEMIASSDVAAPIPTSTTKLPPSDIEVETLVYLLEDDSAYAENLVTQLQRFGYHVIPYGDTENFKAAIEQKCPALIIADITLPEGGMAGITAVRQIHKNYAPDMPVIFISTHDHFNVRLEAVRAGCEAYFLKPVNIDLLIDSLDRLTKHEIPDPFRILIVDDDSTLAAHYALVLRQAGMEVYTTSKPETIFQDIASSDPELILMDIHMPSCSGLELAKLIRQQIAYISIPIVFLSTELNLEKQFAALRLGGDDFLTKPIENDHLVSAVNIRVQRARQLSALMSQDSLTGLLKHSRIKECLASELGRAKRQQSTMSFAMIDIDHFKEVNDNYGHMMGDRVIKSLARLLQQRLRKSDSIGRYGGEEFAVVMPDTDLTNACRVINEIRSNFSEIRFLHEGVEFSVTLSAGIAGYPIRERTEQINQAADEALYKAKQQGRNRAVMTKKEN